jgi:hypothetical protein
MSVSARRIITSTLGLFMVALCAQIWLQFQSSGLAGHDSYYHIKIAYLYSTGELSLLGDEFPWMQHSILHGLRHDWQLGYHLLLIPFSRLPMEFGAKLATALAATLLLTSIYYVLRANGVPLAWVWVTIFTLSSSIAIQRIHNARPAPLAIAMLLLLIHFAMKKRVLATFIWATVALYTYNVPHNVLALTVLATVVHTLYDGRPPYRLAGVMLGAVALTTFAHPGFWHWEGSFFSLDHANFLVWEQMSGTLEAARRNLWVFVGDEALSMPVAVEFRGMPGRELRRFLWVPLLVMFGAIGALALRPRALSRVGITLCAMTGLYFIVMLEFGRFFEYWVPYVFAAAPVAITDALRGTIALRIVGAERLALRRKGLANRILMTVAGAAVALQIAFVVRGAYGLGDHRLWIPAVLLAAVLAGRTLVGPVWSALRWLRRSFWPPRWRTGIVTGLVVVGAAYFTLQVAKSSTMVVSYLGTHGPGFRMRYEGTAKWLRDNTREHDVVYNDWSSWGPLFFLNHWNYYMIGFDPYFMFQRDLSNYRRWISVRSGAASIVEIGSTVRELGSHWVVVERDTQKKLNRRLERAPDANLRYADGPVAIYEIDVPKP